MVSIVVPSVRGFFPTRSSPQDNTHYVRHGLLPAYPERLSPWSAQAFPSRAEVTLELQIVTRAEVWS